MKKATIAPILWQWKAVEYLAYLTAVLLPLVVSRENLFGFTSIKSFILMAIVAGMSTLFVWAKHREIQKGEGSLQITWLHALLIFFATALGVSAVFGVDPHTSWFGTFREGTGLVYIYAFVAWSMLIGSLVRKNTAFLVSFLGVTFATGVFAALLITLKHSTIGNSSFEGAYLLFIACIGLGLLIYSRALWKRVLIGAGMLIVLLSPVLFNAEVLKGEISILTALKNPLLFAGEANGAVLGTAVAFFIAFGLFLIRSVKSYERITGAVLCIAVVGSVAIAGWQLMTPGTAVNRAFVQQKSETRFVYWDIAAAGFLASPIIGYGWGNYDRVFQEYFDPVVFSPQYDLEPGIQDPHNAVWSYASTTGALGLIAYALLMGGAFIALYTASRTDNRGCRIFGMVLAGSIAGYFIQNMFVFDTPISYLLLFSVIGIALGSGPAGQHSLSIRRTLLSAIGAGVVGIAGVVCVVLFSIFPGRESSAWFSLASSAHTPQGISLVGNANDTAYIASALFASTKDVIDTPKKKALYMEKYALLASNLEHEKEKHADNYKIYLVQGILENGLIKLSGAPDPALTASARGNLLRAQTLNPRTPEVYFNLAQTALYERNIAQAFAYTRAGIALEPAYGDGYAIGDVLLKITPNKEFQEYKEKMRR